MKESVKHLIGAITNDTAAYMQTIQHKMVTYAGGAGALIQLRERLYEWLPSFVVEPIYFVLDSFAAIPWMDLLSGVAVLMLIIERCFINLGKWEDYKERKRIEKLNKVAKQMAALITVQDVNDFYPSGFPDAVIQSVIDMADSADACLDGAGVTVSAQKLLKIYACCHQLTLMSGGQVKSQGAMTGDSISFHAASGVGLASTNWGMLLKGMPGADCMEAIFNKSDIQAFSVGRRA